MASRKGTRQKGKRRKARHGVTCAKCGREYLYRTAEDLEQTSEEATCDSCGFLYYAYAKFSTERLMKKCLRYPEAAAFLDSGCVDEALRVVAERESARSEKQILLDNVGLLLQRAYYTWRRRLTGRPAPPALRAISELFSEKSRK